MGFWDKFQKKPKTWLGTGHTIPAAPTSVPTSRKYWTVRKIRLTRTLDVCMMVCTGVKTPVHTILVQSRWSIWKTSQHFSGGKIL